MISDFYAKYKDASDGLPDSFGTTERVEKYRIHLEELLEKGKLFNLTAITDPDEGLHKHIIDSLHAAAAVRDLSEGRSVALIDIGSGGGFPALPIAAACDNVSVTALDATAKKCDFIADTAGSCGVPVAVIPERAEEAVKNLRESFDFATARAVAALNVLAELCAPFVKVGGHFIAMKGSAAKEERHEAENAAAALGLTLENCVPYSIKDGGDRFLLIYKKTSPTPREYPRRFAQIKKHPL